MGVTNELDVYVDVRGEAVRVGTAFFMQRRRGISTTFQYHARWLGRAKSYPVDPGLPLFEGQHHVDGLPGAFADSAPDRWGRNLITKRLRGQAYADGEPFRRPNDVDFLAEVSDFTRQGDLRYTRPDSTVFVAAHTQVPKLIELPTLLRAADEVAANPQGDDMQQVKVLLDAGTGSLGGARPKASVRDRNTLCIAKFPHRSDQWDVTGWEKAALDLADYAGIQVPVSRLTQVGGRNVLVLERFDRTPNSRVGYMSMMTLLQARDGDSRDYLEIAAELSEHTSRPRHDLRSLWQRIVFNVAINNTDDHLRNHGLLHDPRQGWQLSPVFDVNPNPEHGEGRATSILGADSGPEQLDALMDAADAFDVNADRARTVLRETFAAVGRWSDVARHHRLPEREIQFMAEAFEPLRIHSERIAGTA